MRSQKIKGYHVYKPSSYRKLFTAFLQRVQYKTITEKKDLKTEVRGIARSSHFIMNKRNGNNNITLNIDKVKKREINLNQVRMTEKDKDKFFANNIYEMLIDVNDDTDTTEIEGSHNSDKMAEKIEGLKKPVNATIKMEDSVSVPEKVYELYKQIRVRII